MSNFPLVSVLIPLYNKENYIAETINSVLNQVYPNVELIIVDDGSTDNSFNIAEQFISPNIHLFKQSNKGASAARNKAFELSKGVFIQYLDGDDLLHPNKIMEQMSILMQHSLSISTAHWQYFNGEMEENRQDERKELCRNYDDLIDFLLKIMCHGFPIHAWLIPRLIIEKAGKWDEKVFVFDDKDFMMRLILEADSIQFCDAAYCYYRMLSDEKHLSARRDHDVLLGALRHIDNATAYFSTLPIDARPVLACLHKKLLIIALQDIKIINELQNRSIKLGRVPNCNSNKWVRLCEKTMGVRLMFLLVYFRAKYFNITG